jgi:hypothetical protein
MHDGTQADVAASWQTRADGGPAVAWHTEGSMVLISSDRRAAIRRSAWFYSTLLSAARRDSDMDTRDARTIRHAESKRRTQEATAARGHMTWHGKQEEATTTATWKHRTRHDATTATTTMTPVGFPLARYSHHAPREGRSLSTACSRPIQ